MVAVSLKKKKKNFFFFFFFYFFFFFFFFFFFKQKTAYEIVVRDWSSDVCSSDLDGSRGRGEGDRVRGRAAYVRVVRDECAIALF